MLTSMTPSIWGRIKHFTLFFYTRNIPVCESYLDVNVSPVTRSCLACDAVLVDTIVNVRGLRDEKFHSKQVGIRRV